MGACLLQRLTPCPVECRDAVLPLRGLTIRGLPMSLRCFMFLSTRIANNVAYSCCTACQTRFEPWAHDWQSDHHYCSGIRSASGNGKAAGRPAPRDRLRARPLSCASMKLRWSRKALRVRTMCASSATPVLFSSKSLTSIDTCPTTLQVAHTRASTPPTRTRGRSRLHCGQSGMTPLTRGRTLKLKPL